jgi:four helix bundle protein
VKTYKDLEVWKKSIELVASIYEATKQFPKEELYGLTNQIRRSAVSIPSNTAEGFSRASTKEYIQFLYIALGSSAEVETQLIIAKNIGYLPEHDFDKINNELKSIRKMLNALITILKGKLK